MKIVNVLLALMFLVFAYLQFNDPDPLIWISIYGVMVVVCVMAVFQHYPKKFLYVLIILFAAYSVIYIPGVKEWLAQEDKSDLFDNVAKMEHLYIEESREFLGLMICIIVLVVQIISSRKK
ncbi:transmembrane 220 family protein [Chryseolinea sp. H1M3-3]|uniref:transmembrane 220 family protein n=1 Tax=Chryseolinea sp. H1M3-3 TaxID=3034144 RepID=UPI0023EC84D2|nr:transmembrane 220 family protein [Chryseolinea sp. H1M3-3]